MQTDDGSMKIAAYLFRKGENEACMQILNELLDRDDETSVDVLMMIAEIFIREGKYDPAERILKELLKIDGIYGRVHSVYGNVMFAKEHYNRAIMAYEAALQKDYVSSRQLLNYEEAADGLHVRADALELLEENRSKISDSLYYEIQGDIFWARGKTEEAITVYDKAGDGGRERLLSVAGFFMAQKKGERAYHILQRVIDSSAEEDSLFYDALFTQALMEQIYEEKEDKFNYLENIITDNMSGGVDDPFTVIHLYQILIMCMERTKKYEKLEELMEDYEEVLEMINHYQVE